ncbi:YoaK family protein [Thermomonas sp.]
MGVHLPRWVWAGAGVLACVAGMVNVVGYLGFEHQAVTHLTGTTTFLGAALASGDLHAMARFGGVMLAFLFGSALSGMLIQDSTLRLGRRYGVALVLESAMLFAAIPLFMRAHLAGPLLAAAACGLQNAMATTYSGAVIRTSHLSGMFTDLGIGMGHALRGMPLQKRRLMLCGLIICCFLLGAVLGALLFQRVGYLALMVPATLTGLAGLGYGGYRQWQRQQPADTA